MKKIALFFLLIVTQAATAQDEIHFCNGIATNKPCETLTPNTTNVITSPTPAVANDNNAKSKMRDLYHELDMLQFYGKRKYNVKIDIGSALDACIGKDAELDLCRKTTSDLEDKINDRINDERRIAEEKRANEILEKQGNQPNETNVTNIIIHNNEFDDRYPHHIDRHPSQYPGVVPPSMVRPTLIPRPKLKPTLSVHRRR